MVLVRGENYPDALSVSSIAAQRGYPILLVHKNGIPAEVKEKIAAIRPDKIYIIGLQGAVGENVEHEAGLLSGLAAEDLIRIGGEYVVGKGIEGRLRKLSGNNIQNDSCRQGLQALAAAFFSDLTEFLWGDISFFFIREDLRCFLAGALRATGDLQFPLPLPRMTFYLRKDKVLPFSRKGHEIISHK